jgi:hypothetical protein
VSSPRFPEFFLHILLVIFHECVKGNIEAQTVVPLQNDILPDYRDESRTNGEARLIPPVSQRVFPSSVAFFLLLGIVF